MIPSRIFLVFGYSSLNVNSPFERTDWNMFQGFLNQTGTEIA